MTCPTYDFEGGVLLLRSIAVVGGASIGTSPADEMTAQFLGAVLASNSVRMIYGGASTGLLGAVADEVLSWDGEVEGVSPETLVQYEISHTGLTELHVVRDMREHKALMPSLADGFIALAGGMAAAKEIFELATWLQLSLHAKPVTFLNTLVSYDRLFAFLAHSVGEGVIHDVFVNHLFIADGPTQLLTAMGGIVAPPHLSLHCDTHAVAAS